MSLIPFERLLDLARMPDTNHKNWLERADESVDILTKIWEQNEEIVLYASGAHLYLHSFLAPRAAVDPPDHERLANAHINITDTWCIQRSYGGGKGHRVYLEPPLDCPDGDIFSGGEKLVFLRSFEGVKAYQSNIEISQKLVHALDLYYMDERNAFCRLDERGDIENVIVVQDNRIDDVNKHLRTVTIRGRDLATYMALSGTSLVTKFDFTRFAWGAFSGWGEHEQRDYRARDLYYRHGAIPNHASYAFGHIVLHTDLTEEDLIKEWRDEDNASTKQYASFKIFDRKNGRLVETSCGPDHIVNYFVKSGLPWEMSPAFFNSEVLIKYKADPEKYTIEERSISCRGAWYLRTYDINDAGQVHTYIGYLANLPYEEQLYWKAFNEWPKGNISKRAHETDILGEFSTEDDPLSELKGQVQSLDRDTPVWWQRRGEEVVEEVLYPATDSIEEWGNEILALDQMVVEGFHVRGLRDTISTNQGIYENSWGSLKLLECALFIAGQGEEKAKELIAPLKELHDLRNPARAHGSTKRRRDAVTGARKSHGTLRNHFRELAVRVRDSMKQIVSTLPKA